MFLHCSIIQEDSNEKVLCIWFVLGLVSMDVLITPDLSFSDSSQLLAAATPSEGDSIQSVEEMTGSRPKSAPPEA